MRDYSTLGDDDTPPSWDEFEACAQEEGVEVEQCSLYLAWQEAEAEAKKPTVGKVAPKPMPTLQELGWGMAKDVLAPRENKEPDANLKTCQLYRKKNETELEKRKRHHEALALANKLQNEDVGNFYFLYGEFDLKILKDYATRFDNVVVEQKNSEQFLIKKVGAEFDWDEYLGVANVKKLKIADMTEEDAMNLKSMQQEALKNAIVWYLSNPWPEVEKYKVGNEALHAAKILPYSLLQRKLAPMSCYRKAPGGPTAAIKTALLEMQDLGWIAEIKAAVAGLHYGFKGLCYKPIGV